LQKYFKSLQIFKSALQLYFAEVFCNALFEVVYRYCQLVKPFFHADQQISRDRNRKPGLKR